MNPAPPPSYRRIHRLLISIVAVVSIPSWALAQISFTDVTATSQMSLSSAGFGAGWGDLDGDGRPDLFVGNHADALPNLFVNLGDGTFDDVGAVNFGAFLGDPHGVAWADFDNDGDQDLYEIHGSCCNNRLYVNDGGVFSSQGTAAGVAYQTARGRTPAWLDADRDGLLDLAVAVAFRAGSPPTIFRQLPDATFEDVGASWGLTLTSATSAQLSDQDGDDAPELIFSSITGPFRAHSTSGIPLPDVTSALDIPTASNVLDTAMGDFDGDLVSDFFYARAGSAFELAQIDTHSLAARLVTAADEQPFSFQTTGIVTVEIGPQWRISASAVDIGLAGSNPAALSFDLDPMDASNEGLVPHTPGTFLGVVVGFESATNTWTIAQNSVLQSNLYLEYSIRSTEPITGLDVTWNRTLTPFVGMRRILHDGAGGYLIDDNLASLSSCVSATTADFDNDMDLDVFMACTGPAANLDNLLFENDGSGNFTAVPLAGGAAGTALGRSALVVSADYDLDGFVDLFVANGRGDPPLDNGPHELFQNDGGTNHWIQIDLEGTLSNRDGIGATVLLEAGGVVQHREQKAGMHTFTQDFKRIHFGLGANTVVDQITVRWPSGVEQVLQDVAADAIIQIVEPSSQNPVTSLSNAVAALVVVLLIALGIRRIRKLAPATP